jgi:hypothetical protein
MKVKSGYVLKSVAGQYIVVPTGTEAINFNGLLNLNESGKLLFETLLKETSLEELINVLTNTYDIDEATAKADVLSFISKLKSKNILE